MQRTKSVTKIVTQKLGLFSLLGVLGKYTENSKISLTLVLLKIVTLFISPLNELHAFSFYKPLLVVSYIYTYKCMLAHNSPMIWYCCASTVLTFLIPLSVNLIGPYEENILYNITLSRRTTTVRSNDTLVDTPFQLISGFFHVNQGVLCC